MKNLIIGIYFITEIAATFGIIPFLQDVYREYKKTRIPFREDPYVGNKPILTEYDFIVVGTGAGGSAVANRLTETPEWTTLVLEAGRDSSIYTDIPALVSYLQFTDYNWGYRAEHTPGSCLGMIDQRCPWPRGKGVGGTSLLNYMIYTRGNREDYDSFAADGNEGWSYDDVLKYFIKSERNNIPEYQNSSYHGKDGYLTIERIPYKTILVDAFLKAGEEIGLKTIDYTAPDVGTGFSRIQSTMERGRRMSASRAYLESVKERNNLHVAEMARVTKILIDEKSERAIGVEFIKNRIRRLALAKKEVILSAGPLQSPQLLMLSGIGPKAHLEEKNITVIKDLPVGENLHEHWTTPVMMFLVNATNSALTEERTQNLLSVKQWIINGTGILSLAGGVEGIGYVNSKYNSPGEYPDIEYIFAAGGLVSDGGNTVRKGMGLTDEIYNAVYRSIDNRDVWSIWPMLLRPKSSGKVLLRDKNPWHWPLFYYDYYKDSDDVNRMVDAIKKIIDLSQTKAFQSIGSRLHSVPIPQCSYLGFGTDEYWECTIRYITVTLHHQSGTCKMGPESDNTAVVDPQLRVHGISNLRVVDSSIFPRLPSAHLYAPTIMVGEKAADMIKSTWLSSKPNEV